MLVNIKNFSNAIAKVTAFASGEKTVPGVMLDIKENSVNVCYSDGRKSVIEKLEAVSEDGDRNEKIVLNYQRLVDIVSACQPTGRIYTDNMQLKFQDDNTMKVIAEKKIFEHSPNSESDGSYRTLSVFEQSIKWVPAGSDVKVAILSRMNYDTIFDTAEVDEWGIKEIRDILDKTVVEKNKIVYISPKKESAFVSNLAYMTCVPIKQGYNNAMVFTTNTAKSVYDILSKIMDNQEKVNCHIINKKYCCLFTEDKNVGMCVEMADANQIHLTTLGRYQSKEYKNYQLTFVREMLKNVMDAVIASDKSDKTIFRFRESKLEGAETELVVASNNSAASISNAYVVACAQVLDKNNNITELELPVSLKVIYDILNKCTNDYVAIDIEVDETGTKYIRIADIDIEARNQTESSVRHKLGINDGVPTPLEEKLNYRVNILTTKHYTVSAK